jgi:AraC-like DNA-binding protein
MPAKPLKPGADPLVERRVYEQTPDWHRHGFCQLLFGLSGRAELEMQGHLYCTGQLNGVLVPAGCRHDFIGDRANCQLVVDLPLDSVALPQRWLDRPRAFTVPGWLDEHLRRMLAVRQQQAPARQQDWLQAVTLVSHVVEALGGTAGDAAAFPVRQIDAYLRARLASPVDTAELAERFGWKPRRFHDLFCEAFGDTPHRYQARLRLDAATCLLDAGVALAEVAGQLGFSDQAAFTRRFTERFGVPPGKWRQAAAAT